MTRRRVGNQPTIEELIALGVDVDFEVVPESAEPARPGPGAIFQTENVDYHFRYSPALVLHKPKDAALTLGIAERTLRDWIGKGCPGGPGNYCTGDIFEWLRETPAGRACAERRDRR